MFGLLTVQLTYLLIYKDVICEVIEVAPRIRLVLKPRQVLSGGVFGRHSIVPVG